jgi:hypothetical protein
VHTQVVPWQTSPLTQLGEQLVVTQLPLTQLRAPVQAALVPQAQVPEALQLSACAMLHAVQATPLMPQFVVDFGVWQVVPEQQPDAQLEAVQVAVPQVPPLQVPVLQAEPVDPQTQVPEALQVSAVAPQAAQVAPLMPQLAADFVMQVVPTQQPDAQLLALQEAAGWQEPSAWQV